mmetsp:Transcript_21515/g.45498  ORF Transcript_21515/g.45498 Transcript_21515/m.45498 type:complete len:201 (-) Transcript_21515:1623-2225(-)
MLPGRNIALPLEYLIITIPSREFPRTNDRPLFLPKLPHPHPRKRPRPHPKQLGANPNGKRIPTKRRAKSIIRTGSPPRGTVRPSSPRKIPRTISKSNRNAGCRFKRNNLPKRRRNPNPAAAAVVAVVANRRSNPYMPTKPKPLPPSRASSSPRILPPPPNGPMSCAFAATMYDGRPLAPRENASRPLPNIKPNGRTNCAM